jgi:hypothetical protein
MLGSKVLPYAAETTSAGNGVDNYSLEPAYRPGQGLQEDGRFRGKRLFFVPQRVQTGD